MLPTSKLRQPGQAGEQEKPENEIFARESIPRFSGASGPALLDIRLALVLLPRGYSLARETYQ